MKRTTTHILVSTLVGMLFAWGLTASSSTASADGFDLQQFNPMPNQRDNYFGAASGAVAPHLHWSGLLMYNHAANPLISRDADGERLESVVSAQGTLHLLFSLGLLDVMEIGLDLPLVVLQEGTAFPDGAQISGDGSFGLGDLRLVPKFQILSTRETPWSNGISLALLVDVHLPTGDAESLQGGDFRIGPRVAFDATLGGPRIAANLDYLYRSGVQIENLTIDDTFGWTIAGEIPIQESLRLTGEARGRFTLASGGIESAESPTEILLGFKAFLGYVQLVAGGGAGLVKGYGSPDWRAFIGIGFGTPSVVQPDECRVATAEFDCLDVPARSCSDGVLRLYTAVCLEGACSYPVQQVTCASGTHCGEEDGQPACVPEPECRHDSDCIHVPAPTCSDDNLTTYSARCADEACHYDPSTAPCPEGMQCGIESGVPACVPIPVVRIDVETRRIELAETVFFATGSAVIEGRSYYLLDQVAQVMNDNPQIRLVRIEGHTDTVGSRRNNTRLSQQRADSVRQYLIDRGVAAGRMTTQGFGPDRPIADNRTADGRAENRRVEIHILEQD